MNGPSALKPVCAYFKISIPWGAWEDLGAGPLQRPPSLVHVCAHLSLVWYDHALPSHASLPSAFSHITNPSVKQNKIKQK